MTAKSEEFPQSSEANSIDNKITALKPDLEDKEQANNSFSMQLNDIYNKQNENNEVLKEHERKFRIIANKCECYEREINRLTWNNP